MCCSFTASIADPCIPQNLKVFYAIGDSRRAIPMDLSIRRRTISATNDTAPSVRRVSQPLSRYGFSFTDFLVRDFHFGLDPSRPLCKAFQEGHCPDREKGKCYDFHPLSRSFNNLVCKHWLRGLCKKGDQCEFLHEYNLYVLLVSFSSFV